MTAKKSRIKRLIEKDEREKRKEEGYYDGRFRTKVLPNKKKKQPPKKKKILENDDT